VSEGGLRDGMTTFCFFLFPLGPLGILHQGTDWLPAMTGTGRATVTVTIIVRDRILVQSYPGWVTVIK
jgi:hypothetical protein